MLAALLQLDFLLELVLPGGPSVSRSQISELSAPGQPAAWLFRACDIASGLLVLAIVPGWWRVSRTVASGLVVWGLGLAVAAVFPVTCAASLRGHCGGTGLPGPHTGLRENLHDVGSVVSVIGVLLAFLCAAAVLHRAGSRRRAAVVGGLSVLCCLLGLVEATQDVVGASWGRGIGQRLQVALLSVVLVLLADPGRLVSPRPWRSPSGS